MKTHGVNLSDVVKPFSPKKMRHLTCDELIHFFLKAFPHLTTSDYQELGIYVYNLQFTKEPK